MRKSNEDTTKLLEGFFENNDLFTFMSLHNVNFKPHPYMIGSAHVKHASDNHGGELGDETLKAIKCAQPKCNMTYEEHTSDLICFLQLKRNAKNAEVNKTLKAIYHSLGEDAFDGLAFVETKEGYRIAE